MHPAFDVVKADKHPTADLLAHVFNAPSIRWIHSDNARRAARIAPDIQQIIRRDVDDPHPDGAVVSRRSEKGLGGVHAFSDLEVMRTVMSGRSSDI